MQDDEIDYDDYDDFGNIDLELDWDSIGSKEGLVLETFHRTFLKLAIQSEFTKVRTVGVQSVRRSGYSSYSQIFGQTVRPVGVRTLTSRCSADPAFNHGMRSDRNL